MIQLKGDTGFLCLRNSVRVEIVPAESWHHGMNMGLGIQSSGSTSWLWDNIILFVNITSEKRKLPHKCNML